LIVSAKSGKVVIEERLSQHIQSDFVRDRQSDKSFTPDDLIRLMTIARLIALTKQQVVMTADVWTSAKELDARRRLA